MSPKWESNPQSNPYQGFVLPLNYSGRIKNYITPIFYYLRFAESNRLFFMNLVINNLHKLTLFLQGDVFP